MTCGMEDGVCKPKESPLAHYEVYACGNPLMIAGASESLIGKSGLDKTRFRADAFVLSGSPPERKV